MPSGILNPGTTCFIGGGCVIHLPTLFKEIKALEEKGINVIGDGRLRIDARAHIVFDFHQTIDGASEKALGDEKKKLAQLVKELGLVMLKKLTALEYEWVISSSLRKKYQKN